MKLAFTTLGCPQWDLDTILDRATASGYDGVDFRGYLGEMNLPVRPEFSTRADATARRFRDAGLAIPCFSSSAKIYAKPAEAVEEVRRYSELCARFSTPFIRVFGGPIQENVPAQRAIETAAATLRRCMEIASGHGVKLLLETHDHWMDCRRLKALMHAVHSPHVGILWDVHHPWRFIGEPPETTWAALAPWIAYTHVKDSKLTTRKPGEPVAFQYCLTGEGDLPLHPIARTLKTGGYDGYLTYEWEKVWHPDIAEPEIAIPHYARAMRVLLASLSKKQR